MDPQELLEHTDFIHTLARCLVSDVHHADDIEQQTWLAAIENPPTADKPAKLWLSKVAKNFVRIWNRGEARRKKREKASTAKPTSSPYEVLEKEEIRRGLIKAVLSLSEPYRKAIIHRYYDGLKPREIALHLGVPVERVRTQLKRGLAQLRNSLDARHGGREKWLAAIAPLAGVALRGEAVASSGGTSFLQGTLFMSGKAKLVLAASLAFFVTLSLIMIGSDLSGYRSEAPRPPDLTIVESLEAFPDEAEKRAPARVPEKTALPSSLQSVRITGRVCARMDNRGIPGASVSVALIPYNEQIGKVEGHTDDQGQFAFDVPHVEGADPSSVYLTITAEGFLEMATSIPCRSEGDYLACGIFKLDNNEEHCIRVTDLHGRPLNRAMVRIMKVNEKNSIIARTSNADGKILISDHELIDRSSSLNTSNRLCVALFQATGMADHVIFHLNWDSPDPIVVPMHHTQKWEGHVLDKETGIPIENARVGLNMYTGDWASALKTCIGREELSTCTDETGHFAIPMVTFEGTCDGCYGFVCYAPGYCRLSTQDNDLYMDDCFPSKLLLERDKESFKKPRCRAVDSTTLQPLPGFKIKLSPGYQMISDATTDASGEFDVRINSHVELTEGFGVWRFATQIAPPHEKRAFHGRVDPSCQGDNGIWEIPFEPLLLEQLTVGVRDETGSPIECAHVFIMQEMNWVSGYWAERHAPLTDEQGLSRIDLWLIKPARLQFKRISHPSYYFPREIELSVPLTDKTPSIEGVKIDHEKQIIWFTMKRGILLQNIRVVNQDGNPVPDARVIGNITLTDSREDAPTIWKNTDANGYCDMALPPFESGTLCVWRRPDSAANIDYDMVLDRKGVTLHCHDEPPLEKSIQGIVLDEEGSQLGNVMLRLSETAGQSTGREIGQSIRNIYTENDGCFNFPASPTRTYRLEVFIHTWSSHWSLAREETSLTAGTYLTIELSTRERTGLVLHFETFYKTMRQKYSLAKNVSNDFDYSFDYEAWLQTEEGRTVEGVEISKGEWDVHFKNIPPDLKKAYVVIHAKSGEQYTSPLIEIEAGKFTTLTD